MFYKNGLTEQITEVVSPPPYFYHSQLIGPNQFPEELPNYETVILQKIFQVEEPLLEYSPAIFAINEKHQVIYWNSECEEITGIPFQSIQGTMKHQTAFGPERQLHLVDVVLTNDLYLMQKNYPNFKNSTILPEGFQVETTNGDMNRCFQIHASTIRDDHNICIGAMGIILRRGKQGKTQKISSDNHFLTQLLMAMPYSAIQSFTVEGKIKVWNQASERLFQIPRKIAIGKRFQELLLLPEEKALFEHFIADIIQTKRSTVPIDWKVKTLDGKTKYIYTYFIPLIENGNCSEICCVCPDSSTNNELNRALRISEVKYLELFKNTTDLLLDLNLSGDIQGVNQACADFFGFTVEQLQNMNIKQLLDECDIYKFWNYLKKSIKGKAIKSHEFIWQNPDGTRRTVELTIRLANWKHRSIFVIAKDITHRRILENDLHESYRQVVNTLVDFIDTKDIYTGQHSQRLVKDCSYLADRLNLTQKQKNDLEVAAILHDVGKIKIPMSILKKFDILTPEEREIMHKHAEMGANSVARIPRFSQIGKIIKYHHEQYNGSGYPEGLVGEEIPIEARILSVVDSFDAMMSDRPYRKSIGIAVTLQELRNGHGSQFDPVVCDTFIEFLKRKYHVDDNGLPDYLQK